MTDTNGASPSRRKSKRPNGDGSFRQRTDGRWEVRFILENGRRKSLYGSSYAEVRRLHKAAIADQEQGRDLSARRMTVGIFLDQWLSDVVRPNLAPKTIAQYSDLVRVHLAPSLGAKPLDRLSSADVTRLLASKRASGLSPKTCNHLRATLRTALNVAKRWGLIARNPVDGTDPVRGESRPIEPLSREEVGLLLDAIDGHRFEALFRVSLSLGLRIGEALALKWENVDFDGLRPWSAGRPAIRVEWTLQRVKGDNGASSLVLKRPKTEKSRRVVPLPGELAGILRRHKAAQSETRIAHADVWAANDLVFTTVVGTGIDPRNALRSFHDACARAEIPRRRLHDLRHTAVTMLLAQGVPLRVVSELLGHSQLSTTSDIYGHVLSETLSDATDKLSAAIAAASRR